MTNAYQFWQAALKKEAPTAVVDEPQVGFWRMKSKRGWQQGDRVRMDHVPIAVFMAGPSICFKFGASMVPTAVGYEQWPHYCANPVTEEVYRGVAENGEDWPDADPTVSAIISQNKPITVRSPGIPNPEADAELERAFISENDRRNADPTTEFREQINTALGAVPSYAKIESDEADIRALSVRNLLNELAVDADKAREAEKKPHWDAAKAVDLKWQPLVKSARDGAGQIKAARDRWADDKLKASRAAAERAKDAEQEAMVAGRPPAPTPPSNLPPPTTQVRPAYGKASPTGTKMVVTAIDYDKFFAALKTRPEWPTVKAQFDEWAQKLANKGIIPDGVTAEERANTR